MIELAILEGVNVVYYILKDVLNYKEKRRMNKFRVLPVIVMAFAIIFASCKKEEESTMMHGSDTAGSNTQQLTPDQYSQVEGVTVAVVELSPASGSSVKGFITFTKTDSGMLVAGEISGLTPGMHGFHIHQFGDCSAPDATSAGDHFNPEQMPHAGHQTEKRHVGDMGNINADNDGNATVQLLDDMMEFDGTNNILGKSVLVHQNPDDLKTQPSGNSGARIACGVITPAKQ